MDKKGTQTGMRKKPATIRLFVDEDLVSGHALTLDQAASHYLLSVMRMGVGDGFLLFNGRDGEWLALVRDTRKKAAGVEVMSCTRGQDQDHAANGPVLAFAPLKRGPMSMIVEKATELGVGCLQPVVTARTNTERVRRDRLWSTAREAAEQCARLSLPDIRDPLGLEDFLHDWPDSQPLYFCDEAGDAPPILRQMRSWVSQSGESGVKPGILIGPEGGFDDKERALIRAQNAAVPVSLGRLVLRAETAALMALSVLRAVGDDMGPDL